MRTLFARELSELLGITSHSARPATATAFGGDEAIAQQLQQQEPERQFSEAKTTGDDVIDSAFGHQVVLHDTPPIDVRKHSEPSEKELMALGAETPGGDVMGQTAWQKWRVNARGGHKFGGVSVPPEEDWYLGAKLGEYARPLIMGEGKVGYLNQAPVPMSPSEDLLTLMSEAGVGSRRARHAAMYAKMSAAQAEEFFRLAQRRARQIFHDPPISVRPGGDVFPFYSAASPVHAALVAPRVLLNRRHRTSPGLAQSLGPCQRAGTVAVLRRARRRRQSCFL